MRRRKVVRLAGMKLTMTLLDHMGAADLALLASTGGF